MSTIRERAPIAPDADQLLDELRQTLVRAEALWTDLAALLSNGPATTPDPLAAFCTPTGTVCYRTCYVDQLVVGDMVQACHGDPVWHRVTDVRPGWLRTRCAIGDPDGVLVTLDAETVKCWGLTDAIRVACSPGEAVACQGADRAEVAG